jgi:hypothetical protein
MPDDAPHTTDQHGDSVLLECGCRTTPLTTWRGVLGEWTYCGKHGWVLVAPLVTVPRATYKELVGLVRMWDGWLLLDDGELRDQQLAEVSAATAAFCGSEAGARMEEPIALQSPTKAMLATERPLDPGNPDDLGRALARLGVPVVDDEHGAG